MMPAAHDSLLLISSELQEQHNAIAPNQTLDEETAFYQLASML
jgi:hypothetical protein